MRGERILLIQESFCIIFIRKTINIVVNLIFFSPLKPFWKIQRYYLSKVQKMLEIYPKNQLGRGKKVHMRLTEA